MRRILVGYDGSEPAGHALDQAARLAKALNCPLTVLTAAAERLVRGDGVVTVALDEEQARQVASRGAARARDYGVVDVETRTSDETPAHALIAEAQRGYDLVVVGHRGRSPLQELFLGSTAKSVVDHLHCSVLVVR